MDGRKKIQKELGSWLQMGFHILKNKTKKVNVCNSLYERKWFSFNNPTRCASVGWRRISDLTGEEVRPFNTFLRQNMLLSPSPSFRPLVILIHSLYRCITPLSLICFSLMCFNLHLPVFAPFNLALTSLLPTLYRIVAVSLFLLPVKAAAMTFNPCCSCITITCSYLFFSSLVSL